MEAEAFEQKVWQVGLPVPARFTENGQSWAGFGVNERHANQLRDNKDAKPLPPHETMGEFLQRHPELPQDVHLLNRVMLSLSNPTLDEIKQAMFQRTHDENELVKMNVDNHIRDTEELVERVELREFIVKRALQEYCFE